MKQWSELSWIQCFGQAVWIIVFWSNVFHIYHICWLMLPDKMIWQCHCFLVNCSLQSNCLVSHFTRHCLDYRWWLILFNLICDDHSSHLPIDVALLTSNELVLHPMNWCWLNKNKDLIIFAFGAELVAPHFGFISINLQFQLDCVLRTLIAPSFCLCNALTNVFGTYQCFINFQFLMHP